MASLFQLLVLGSAISSASSRSLGVLAVKTSGQELERVKERIKAGDLAPVIDRRFPLDEVPEALRYHGEGHARGKVVIGI